MTEIGAPINRLWISTAPLPSFPSDRALTAEDMARIKGAEILVDVGELSNIEASPNLAVRGKRRALALPLTLLNVISIENNLYVLAVDGIQAEIAAPRSVDGTIGLYVLKLLSENNIRAVCHFRSRLTGIEHQCR